MRLALLPAAQALGSIEQFKIFGPPEEQSIARFTMKTTSSRREDPFVIETDKVLGVGGQGTVYLCHKQRLGSRILPKQFCQVPKTLCCCILGEPRSTPNVKHAVKTIPIWRLLMERCPSSVRRKTEPTRQCRRILPATRRSLTSARRRRLQ